MVVLYYNLFLFIISHLIKNDFFKLYERKIQKESIYSK